MWRTGNRPEYGFTTLATRYEYLIGQAPSVGTPARCFDVDELLAAHLGEDYPHGKLEARSDLIGALATAMKEQR